MHTCGAHTMLRSVILLLYVYTLVHSLYTLGQYYCKNLETISNRQGLMGVIICSLGGVGIHAALSLVFLTPGRGQWCTWWLSPFASDKPGHVTSLTASCFFNSFQKNCVHRSSWGRHYFWAVWRALAIFWEERYGGGWGNIVIWEQTTISLAWLQLRGILIPLKTSRLSLEQTTMYSNEYEQ
jgi:hypothetical protein